MSHRLVALPLLLTAASCDRAVTPAPQRATEPPPSAEAPRPPSDLDKPIEALFAETCEHRKKTFECQECRYGIGVVRAPKKLFDGGLLRVEHAEQRRVASPLELTGEVRFDERRVAHVSSQAEGIVRAVHVTLGDKVKRGQPLLELDSIAIGEAQAEYLETAGLLTLARREHERLTALRQESIASEKELLKSNQELGAAEIRAEAALGKLTRLGVDVGTAQSLTRATASGRLVLRAPVDGTVLVLHAVPGEVSKTEESLATIGDNATVWVWADLYDRDIAAVAAGQARAPLAAGVSVRAYPNQEFPGRVGFLSPAMDEASRTVKLRIEVPNAEGRLLAGMFASVKVFLPGSEQALALPADAVLEDEGRSFVFVHHHDDYFVRRPVTLGRRWAAFAEVTSGVTAGQEVVSGGAFLMKSDVLRSKMGAGCAD
jgi:cobalt-zinc-cadmium efflux system membrane fusion protein